MKGGISTSSVEKSHIFHLLSNLRAEVGQEIAHPVRVLMQAFLRGYVTETVSLQPGKLSAGIAGALVTDTGALASAKRMVVMTQCIRTIDPNRRGLDMLSVVPRFIQILGDDAGA